MFGYVNISLDEVCLKTESINWKREENVYQYVDLSSVDRDFHKILDTSLIDKNNAPSRAQQIIKQNDVLFGGTRPMLKRYCIIPKSFDCQICSTGFCVLRPNLDFLLPKWIYYIIGTTNFYNYVEITQKGASYPAITDKEVKKYNIPLPTIEQQRKIINKLDNLERLCNDISEGLPAEIESRQKQYEYYRDKLLTFKPLKEN